MEFNHNMNMLLESFNVNKELIALLLIDAKKAQEFFERFYSKNKYMIDDLLDYREFRILEDCKTLVSLKQDCDTLGFKDAFEKTFYQSFGAVEIDLITQSISDGKISLEVIFEGFKKHPNRNILKNLL